jgi:hypothetical protein
VAFDIHDMSNGTFRFVTFGLDLPLAERYSGELGPSEFYPYLPTAFHAAIVDERRNEASRWRATLCATERRPVRATLKVYLSGG